MLQDKKFVIVSRRKNLYNRVRGVILRDSPASDVVSAGSLKEAFRILNSFEGSGILLTDMEAASSLSVSVPDSFEDDPDHFPEQIKYTRGNSKEEIEFIKVYILTHLEEDLSLALLSQKVSLSPNYLCVLFRRIEGISVRQFIENARIDRAAYLLVTENSLTSEIAERVGYHHSSYFCKMFRKHYGTTPRRYRKMHTELTGAGY